MITDRHRTELAQNGFVVIENVLTEEECDERIGEYKTWLQQFRGPGEWPKSLNSLIRGYNAGNLEPTWKVRLAVKSVYEQIWKTPRLLSSIETVAIGRPPEEGEEEFDVEGKHWLHCDQGAEKFGLHAYQGGVYLEAAEEDDWTFYVLQKSHKFLDEFYASDKKVAEESARHNFFNISANNLEWFKSKGCELLRVAVPKGGMVVWDSRLIHANARPVKGRKNPGRWRFTVLVCMTPACWANKSDLEKRQAVYKSAAMISHWPSQDVRVDIQGSSAPSEQTKNIVFPEKMSGFAATDGVQELCGYKEYDFSNVKSNPEISYPKWKQVLHNPPSEYFLDQRSEPISESTHDWASYCTLL